MRTSQEGRISSNEQRSSVRCTEPANDVKCLPSKMFCPTRNIVGVPRKPRGRVSFGSLVTRGFRLSGVNSLNPVPTCFYGVTRYRGNSGLVDAAIFLNRSYRRHIVATTRNEHSLDPFGAKDNERLTQDLRGVALAPLRRRDAITRVTALSAKNALSSKRSDARPTSSPSTTRR